MNINNQNHSLISSYSGQSNPQAEALIPLSSVPRNLGGANQFATTIHNSVPLPSLDEQFFRANLAANINDFCAVVDELERRKTEKKTPDSAQMNEEKAKESYAAYLQAKSTHGMNFISFIFRNMNSDQINRLKDVLSRLKTRLSNHYNEKKDSGGAVKQASGGTAKQALEFLRNAVNEDLNALKKYKKGQENSVGSSLLPQMPHQSFSSSSSSFLRFRKGMPIPSFSALGNQGGSNSFATMIHNSVLLQAQAMNEQSMSEPDLEKNITNFCEAVKTIEKHRKGNRSNISEEDKKKEAKVARESYIEAKVKYGMNFDWDTNKKMSLDQIEKLRKTLQLLRERVNDHYYGIPEYSEEKRNKHLESLLTEVEKDLDAVREHQQKLRELKKFQLTLQTSGQSFSSSSAPLVQRLNHPSHGGVQRFQALSTELPKYEPIFSGNLEELEERAVKKQKVEPQKIKNHDNALPPPRTTQQVSYSDYEMAAAEALLFAGQDKKDDGQ